jgi:Methyltransferase domain
VSSFVDSCDEKQTFVRLLSDRTHSLPLKKEDSRILDIGSNDGQFVGMYLSALDSSGFRGSATCVEPSLASLNRFRWDLIPKGFSAATHHGRAEKFFAESNFEPWDLIIASHSLYWVDDIYGLIKTMIDQTKSLCIIVRGERGTFDVQSKFHKELGEPEERLYHAKTIRDILQKIGSVFHEDQFAATVAVPALHSPQWSAFAGFLLQRDPSSIDSNLSRDVWDLLATRSNFIEDNSVFWIEGSGSNGK